MSGPKCPNCTSTDRARVDHACGKWLCGSCDFLYDGGDLEWLNMTQRRTSYLALLKRLSEEQVTANQPPGGA